GFAVACLLGRAARAIAFDEKDLGARSIVAGAVGKLAWEAELAGRSLAGQLALLAAALTFLGPFGNAVEELPGGSRIGAQPMIEMILHGILDELGRLGRGESLLGLALKLGIAHKKGQQHGSAGSDVLARRLGDAPIANELAIPFDPAQQRAAQPRIVGPTFR